MAMFGSTTLPLSIFTLHLIFLTDVAGQLYDWRGDEERGGPFCGRSNRLCCTGRQDECSLERDGGRTKCYCDEFCVRSHAAPYEDCCWDYRQVCLGEPAPLKVCDWRGYGYQKGEQFSNNCQKCQCVDQGHSMKIMCSYDKTCLIDEELIRKVNQEDRGWWAGNVTTFWGRSLSEGLEGLLGTHYSSHKVRKMFPIKVPIRRYELPDSFDWRQKNPEYISPIEDQNFCNASWAFAIVSTFSDRLSKWSKGRNREPMSYQQLMTCPKGQKRKNICSAGFLTKSWKYMMTSGLTTSSCYPRSSETQCEIQERRLAKRISVVCPGGGTGQLFRASALSRIARDEAAIRREIYDSGSVIATMRVFPDFFVYKGGVYTCPIKRPAKQGRLHAVKLIGWGEDSRRVPYWVAANSWGRAWGEDGFFKIRRGYNDCDIEEFILAFYMDRSHRARRNALAKWKDLLSFYSSV